MLDSTFESSTPRLKLVVSSVKASVKQTTWNLVVAASMNSITIKDYFASFVGVAGGAEPQLLLAAVAEDEQDKGEFLSVEYVKVCATV